jgi:hypothetical protein
MLSCPVKVKSKNAIHLGQHLCFTSTKEFGDLHKFSDLQKFVNRCLLIGFSRF